ncbi:MAG: Lrp/AsnC family transcriptional regulator [Gammaproteobacteria bacterium]|nr:Lrp/AsnC family transcriptional regulator [Gammaproteobacteria bacterium]MDE0365189.1 Lrp/AsnC family transcriptional regulator [Gammaproteobacteria bacterium]
MTNSIENSNPVKGGHGAAFAPDDLDERIIALLREDGRMPTRDVAARANTSPATVRKRIRAMEAAGFMRVVAVTDFAAAGFDLLIAIGIEVENRSAEAVGLDLADLPEVFAVNLTTGPNDLEILVAAQSFEQLATFLHKEVSRVDGIGRLTPALTVDVRKYVSEQVPRL